MALLVALLGTDEISQFADLVSVDKGALHPFHLDTGVVEHVSLSDQFLGPWRVEDSRRVDPGDNPEGNPRREVGLDQASNHIHGRPLGRQHDVDTGSPTLLRQTDDGRRDASGHSLGVSATTN